MKLHFYGADRCVTGSCHCLEINGKRILVDCGLQQGRDELDNAMFAFNPGDIDILLVTHAPGKIQARHIVLICSHSAFNRLLHQSPAFGNSYTLCASDWEKFLDNYVKIWSPFDLDCEHPDEARKMADRIFNIPCSTDESMLIERTLAAYCAI